MVIDRCNAFCGKIGYVSFFVLAVAGEKEIGVAYGICYIFYRYLKGIDKIYEIGFCDLVFARIDKADFFLFTAEIIIEGITAADRIGIGIS